ncbi:MAG: GNAT family N-acetyltransferase [Bacteroidota bacterium]
MIGLATERLIFRQRTQEDYPEFAAFFSKEETYSYVGGVKSPEASWRLMARYIGHYELNGYSFLALAEKHSKTFIGTLGLRNSSPWPEPELGYWLLPQFQGKGFGAEAGLALKQFALDTLQLNSLVSHIASSSTPSKKLAERLGAQFDTTCKLLAYGTHEIYRYK